MATCALFGTERLCDEDGGGFWFGGGHCSQGKRTEVRTALGKKAMPCVSLKKKGQRRSPALRSSATGWTRYHIPACGGNGTLPATGVGQERVAMTSNA